MTDGIPILTVRQPWAGLIIAGHKDVENRSRRTHHRGWIALHAGQTDDPRGWSIVQRRHLKVVPAYGTILGLVRIVDCVRDSASPWAFPDCWHWLLADAVQLARPIPCRGQLGLFRAPAAVAHKLRHAARQLA